MKKKNQYFLKPLTTNINNTTFGVPIRKIKPGNNSGSYDENCACWFAKPSKRMGKRASHDATMFCTLKSRKRASKPSFWTIRANLRDASFAYSSVFAPVTTTLPDAKINALRMMMNGGGKWKKLLRKGGFSIIEMVFEIKIILNIV